MREELESHLAQQVSDLRALGRQLYASRPDLQKSFDDPESSAYWQWLQTHGFWEVPQVRELCVPLPPPAMRAVVNVGDSWSFLLCGAAAHAVIARAIEKHKRSFSDLAPVLDFGCGPGRCLRMMLRYADRVEVVGTDVDATAVEWCRANFPFGEFHVNHKRPPTDLPSARFGLVYAISVFSHLAEDPHLAWLHELHRVTRKDALLVLTVHGPHALRRAKADAEPCKNLLGLNPRDLRGASDSLEARGFAFVRESGVRLDEKEYGITFINEEYVRRVWSREFEVVGYEEAALDGLQDAVVLRRP